MVCITLDETGAHHLAKTMFTFEWRLKHVEIDLGCVQMGKWPFGSMQVLVRSRKEKKNQISSTMTGDWTDRQPFHRQFARLDNHVPCVVNTGVFQYILTW
jgi:hypothetical protein